MMNLKAIGMVPLGFGETYTGFLGKRNGKNRLSYSRWGMSHQRHFAISLSFGDTRRLFNLKLQKLSSKHRFHES